MGGTTESFTAESTVRSRAKRLGWAVRKSRQRLGLDNQGGYCLVDPYNNRIIAGEKYDWMLEDINDFLSGRGHD